MTKTWTVVFMNGTISQVTADDWNVQSDGSIVFFDRKTLEPQRAFAAGTWREVKLYV
jgi:hypothetical protein